ncbi:MAG TPA: S9 family peptidase, partial [Chitinophagaceae bacterium]|nr:S9 family peptidase [Chitinophagaceae bacterium]
MNKFLLTFTFFLIVLTASAQQNNVLTTKDYEHAEDMMGYSTQQYVDRANVIPNWIAGDKFWYRVLVPQGSEFILVDPSKGTKSAAFDQQKLAAALSTTSGKSYSAFMLPFRFFTYSSDGGSIIFRADGQQWK